MQNFSSRKLLLLGVLVLGAVWLHAQVSIGLTTTVPGYPFPPAMPTQTAWPTGVTGPVSLNYSVSGVSGSATNPVITLVLPANFDYVDIVPNLDVASYNYVAGTRTLTITLISPMSTGTTGVIDVLGRFPFGITPDADIANLNPTFTATGVTNSPVSAPGSVEAEAVNPWNITKSRTSGGALDGNTTYRIRFPDANLTTAAMYLVNATMVDQLPVGTTFVSASNSGVYNAGANTVTWTGVNLTNPDGNIDYTVTVSYTSAGGFITGQSVTNQVSISGELAETGGVLWTDNASVTHTIQDFIGGGCSGNVSINRSIVGQTGTFTMQPINSSTKAVDNFKVTMNLSPLVTYTSFAKGRYGTAAYQGKTVNVYYTSNVVTTPTLLGSYTTQSGTSTNLTAPTLAVGDYMTSVIYEFGTVPAGFTTSGGTHQLIANFTLNSTTPAGATVNAMPAGGGLTCTTNATYDELNFNTVTTFTYDIGSGPTAYSATCSACRVAEQAGPTLSNITKSYLTAGPFSPISPNDDVLFQIEFRNTGTADMINTVVTDTLPTGFTYSTAAPWSMTVQAGAGGAPTFATSTAPDGRQILTWTFASPVAVNGTSTQIQFTALIGKKAPPGDTRNKVWVDANAPVVPQFAQTNILVVQPVPVLSSRKGVKGVLDADYKYLPDAGTSVIGGDCEYRLVVRNDGNVPMKDIVAVDILPFVGDFEVLNVAVPRGTNWRPFLTNPVAAPGGVSVYYTTENNPCRSSELGYTASGCTGPAWSASPPTDITTTQALKFFYAGPLPADDSLVITWTMNVPLGAPTSFYTYNSFAFTGTKTSDNITLSAAEPNKIGVLITVDPAKAMVGDYLWYDLNANGLQDEVVSGPGAQGKNGIRAELWLPGADSTVGTSDDAFVKATSSGPDVSAVPGFYTFGGVDPGRYYIRIVPLPYGPSAGITGFDAANRSAIFRLSAGQTKLNLDFPLGPPDNDRDLIPDITDVDDDNDGIPDVVETCGSGATSFSCMPGSADYSADTDADGTPNYIDPDYGTRNTASVTASLDYDNDGIINAFDKDSDNDGVPDLIEAGGIDTNGDGLVDYSGTFASNDTDSDGWINTYDDAPAVSGHGAGTLPVPNNDGDTYMNFLDKDSDNDGITDLTEMGGADTDGDGAGDVYADYDLDGFADRHDPDDDLTAGLDAGEEDDVLVRTGADVGGDGLQGDGESFASPAGVTFNKDNDPVYNFLDRDSDNDGITDLIEAGGADINGDGAADAATDADNDGYADIYDTDIDGIVGPDGATTKALVITNSDANNNGLTDGSELLVAAESTTKSKDQDRDGLVNWLDLDADNDGIPDISETYGNDANGNGLVPMVFSGGVAYLDANDNGIKEAGETTLADADNDGYFDPYDPDDDNTRGGNGAMDAGETTAPTLKTSSESGTADGKINTITEYVQFGTTADNTGNHRDNDLDKEIDLKPSWLDVDADNDGITDLVEVGGSDADGNGFVDVLAAFTFTLATDADNDGFADRYDTDDNNDGVVESTTSMLVKPSADANGDYKVTASVDYFLRGDGGLLDVDRDNRPTWLDLDSEGDGIPDVVEAWGTDTDSDAMPANYSDADNDGYTDLFDSDYDLIWGTDAGATTRPLTRTTADANNDGKASGAEYATKSDGTTGLDYDSDGFNDMVDRDADNDGIPDVIEAYGTDGNGNGRSDESTTDADFDGFVDRFDGNEDADALIDVPADALVRTPADFNLNGKQDDGVALLNGALTRTMDMDADGIPNWLDLDSDQDGLTDLLEALGIDTDGNGRVDGYTGGDLDGYADAYDSDDNEDNTVDGATDPLVRTSGDAGTNSEMDQNDEYRQGAGTAAVTFTWDIDRLPAFYDRDSDDDGIPDLIEAGGTDVDGNGVADNTTDSDLDGLLDVYDSDATDGPGPDGTNGSPLAVVIADISSDRKADDGETYRFGSGASSTAADADNFPNWRDLDADNDGIQDIIEAGGADANGNGYAQVAVTAASSAPVYDLDDNGTVDAADVTAADADRDGLMDIYDVTADDGSATSSGTNGAALITTAADANSNGLANEGYNSGINIEDDLDGDSRINAYDLDSDGDGMPDPAEANDGVMPTGIAHTTQGVVAAMADVVSNGWDDGYEGPGRGLLITPNDDDLDGIADEGYTGTGDDFDSDNKPTCYDIDADNDGILDVDEMQPSVAGKLPVGTDTDGDGLDNAFDPDCAPCGAVTGVVVETPNNDDGVANTPDFLDLDADDDLSRDWIEGFEGVDANIDALAEVKARMELWRGANCASNIACAVYNNGVDVDGDGYPAWLDQNDAVAAKNQGTDFAPPFTNPASSYYVDQDGDGLVDVFDATFGSSPSNEPEAGTASQSSVAPGGSATLPDYRNIATVVTFPVEWLEISATLEMQAGNPFATVTWTTASEREVSHFEVERSTDGSAFVPVGQTPATGNSATEQSYTFEDRELPLRAQQQMLYYQVRSVDANGSTSLSEVATVTLSGTGTWISAVPNPATDVLTIRARSVQPNSELRMIAADGRVIWQQPLTDGYLDSVLSLEQVAAGLYLLEINEPRQRVTVRVVVQ